MNETVILITSGFPFGTNEAFLETEILFLSNKFKRVVIFSLNNNSLTLREVPINVHVERYVNTLTLFEKLLSIFALFKPIVYRELYFIKKKLDMKRSVFKIKTLLITLYKARKIKAELKKISIKYDALPNSTVYYSYWLDEGALALALMDTAKSICRVHGWDLFYERSQENYLPFRYVILKSVKCYSISEIGKHYLENLIGININISKLGTQEFGINKYRSETKTIVSCSSLIPIKNVKLIIEALGYVKKEVNWIHFGDGPLFNEVDQCAKRKGINFHLKGNISNKELLAFYDQNSISLFINLSLSEGIPVSIMEAYSCGIPAIATDVGGTSEIVNNENGVLLKANPTKKEVAFEITKFFELTEKEIKIKRQNAYNTWKEKFNAEKNYTEFAEIISKL